MPKNNDFKTNSGAEVAAANVPTTENSEELSTMRVSKRTAMYIALLDDINVLWERVYDTLEKDYSSSVDTIFDKSFLPHFNGMRKEVEDFVADSISEHLSRTGNTQII